MSALITSVEHALATAARDTVKVAKFVEVKVLPALKQGQANPVEASQWRNGQDGQRPVANRKGRPQ